MFLLGILTFTYCTHYIASRLETYGSLEGTTLVFENRLRKVFFSHVFCTKFIHRNLLYSTRRLTTETSSLQAIQVYFQKFNLTFAQLSYNYCRYHGKVGKVFLVFETSQQSNVPESLKRKQGGGRP